MKFLKSRKGAFAVMLLLIILSIGFGSHRSLSALSQDVQAKFEYGEDGSGLSIQNDLNKRVDLSYNMVTIAKKYIDPNDHSIQAVLQARDSLSNAATPSAKYKANAELTEATTDLYDKLKDIKLSDTDSGYRTKIFADLTSRNDTIGNDKYNQYAQQFNQTLQTFPANLLSKFTFIQPAELYK